VIEIKKVEIEKGRDRKGRDRKGEEYPKRRDPFGKSILFGRVSEREEYPKWKKGKSI